MSESYVGEIRMFGFGRVPSGWLRCDGSLLPISQYSELFSVIGTTYGGDGQKTFATPQLSGRVPINQGAGPGLSAYSPGQTGGSEAVSLVFPQMPAHGHAMAATTGAASASAISASVIPGALSGDTMYASDIIGATPFLTAPQSSAPSGGNMPHANTMPTLTVQFCIAAMGVMPVSDQNVA